MPPSRTMRFEPRPMVVTGISRGRADRTIGEIVLVGRGKQGLSRTADPKPGRVRNRRVGDEASAQLGRPRLHLVDKIGASAKRQALSSAASSPGSA